MKKMIFKKANDLKGVYNHPKDGQIVVVTQCPIYSFSYDVVGYEVDLDGRDVSFNKKHFREIQTNTISKKLAESFIKEDSKVREQEHEKVFSLTREF